MLKGIDVSKWQGTIDFSKLKTDFIIIRASYGTGFIDSQFTRNREEARKRNIPIGFYHYSYPQHNSPEAEADWFTKVLGEVLPGESLYLDFEEAYPDPVTWSKRFLDKLSTNFKGYKPLIYLNKNLVETNNWEVVADANYGLWLAYWNYLPNVGTDIPYWEVIAMRQYSNKLEVDGINGRVDGNVFYGDVATFKKYGIEESTGDPIPVPNPEYPMFGFDVTKKLPDEAWTQLGYGKYPAIGRDWALDTLGEKYQQLSDELEGIKPQLSQIESLKSNVAKLQAEIQRLSALLANAGKQLCDYSSWERFKSLFTCPKGGE